MGVESNAGHARVPPGEAVANGLDAVAHAAERGLNALEEVLADLAETLGKALADATDAVARRLRPVPVAGAAAGGFVRWLGRVASGALDIVGAAVKGAVGIVANTVGGLLRAVAGVASRDRARLVRAAIALGSGVAGAAIVVAGKAVALVQAATFAQASERRLTAEESALLRTVFRRSVALYNVRIVEGRSGLFGVNKRPFTLCNTIYLKERSTEKEPELLVHECTHVWQYQNLGARYTSDALAAQRFVENAYSWDDEIKRGNDRWTLFNREAQAALLEDVYAAGQLVTETTVVTGNGAFYDRGDGAEARDAAARGRFLSGGSDHTALAEEAVRAVRARRSFRASSLL